MDASGYSNNVNMKNIRNIILSLVITAVIMVVYFMWFRDDENLIKESSIEQKTEQKDEQKKDMKNKKTYTDFTSSFSFDYPDNFTIENIDNVSDRIIIFSESSRNNVFQLNIKPWSLSEKTITAERIYRDLPQYDIRNPQSVEIEGQIRGVSFINSSPEVGGEVRQIWFVMNGYLYQFTAPIISDDLLQAILSTFVSGR